MGVGKIRQRGHTTLPSSHFDFCVYKQQLTLNTEINLAVLEGSGEGSEKIYARKVLTLLKRGKHWLLVTLLLCNVITNETLPIVLDRSLGGGWPAVVSSTALIGTFFLFSHSNFTNNSSYLRRGHTTKHLCQIWITHWCLPLTRSPRTNVHHESPRLAHGQTPRLPPWRRPRNNLQKSRSQNPRHPAHVPRKSASRAS